MYVISSHTKIQVNLKNIAKWKKPVCKATYCMTVITWRSGKGKTVKTVNRSVIARALNRWITGEVFRAVCHILYDINGGDGYARRGIDQNHQVVSVCFKVWEAQVCYDPCISRWYSGKESSCQCRRRKRHGFDPWVGKILWRRKWQSIPVFLPGEFHEERSLVGYKESDTTEGLSSQRHTQSSSTGARHMSEEDHGWLQP